MSPEHIINEHISRELKWIQYCWEFMRRDPEYLRAWEEALGLREKFGQPTGGNPEEHELCRKFGLHFYELPNPSLSFEEVVREVIYESLDIEGLDDPRRWPAFAYFFGQSLRMSRDKAFFYDSSADGARIEIWINFERVNSIDFLKKHVAEAIDELWREYRDAGEHTKKTVRMTDYDKILEIGDLREKNPDMTFKEIADQVFPYDESPESAEKKAQQHYSRYEELRNGGWRDFKPV